MSSHRIRYQLSFDAAAQHLVDVVATYPAALVARTESGHRLELMLPVWTPGSYMVREFARHLESVAAESPDGTPRAMDKVSKNVWHVELDRPGDVIVRYRVYGRELTVRSNNVEADFALLQGAATYLLPSGASAQAAASFEVAATLPPGWTHLVCGLETQVRAAGPTAGTTHTLRADDADVLVDTPLLLGCPKLQHFELAGVPHTLALIGGDDLLDMPRIAADWRRIAEATLALWGQLPYPRYAMMGLMHGGRGGLEHRHSAVIMGSPYTHRTVASHQEFLGLIAHEHFHAWNIKRLRPIALGPFDYHQECYTPSLWVAEGLTAYYDNLLVRRAGLLDDDAYLALLAKDVTALENTPGRLVQSLTEASHDAWIKFYRRDENTDNTAVSYYLKGSLVGLVLDAWLRLHGAPEDGLDAVMRAAYAQFSGPRGFTEAQFRQVVEQVAGAGAPIAAWLEAACDLPGELDLSPLTQAYGLAIARGPAAPGRVGAAPAGARVRLGAGLSSESGRLTVTQVQRGRPAYAAGLQVGDELIAVGEQRVTPAEWPMWLEQATPGAPVSLLVARHMRLRRLDVTPEAAVSAEVRLTLSAKPTDAQRRARMAWLSGPAAVAGRAEG